MARLSMPKPQSFRDVETFMGKKYRRTIGNNTTIEWNGEDKYTVRLHGNTIVEYRPESVTIYDGGWQTVTTKDRLNRLTPVSITQSKWRWFIGCIPFLQGGIKVDYSGYPVD